MFNGEPLEKCQGIRGFRQSANRFYGKISATLLEPIAQRGMDPGVRRDDEESYSAAVVSGALAPLP